MVNRPCSHLLSTLPCSLRCTSLHLTLPHRQVVNRPFSVLTSHTHAQTHRQVVNPFEEEGVVGITNYVDVGLQLTTAIGGATQEGAGAKGDGGGGGVGSAAERPGVNLAASWQVGARRCGLRAQVCNTCLWARHARHTNQLSGYGAAAARGLC